MSLPLPPPPSHRDAYLIGEVEVHPNAVIALGVLLHAEPGSKITVASGVCIGMGSILHASGGVLEICEGVNLGTGVLLIGTGKVGNYACVGSSSTLINPDLKVAQVLPPGTLLGDTSRPAEILNGSTPEPVLSPPGVSPPIPSRPVVPPLPVYSQASEVPAVVAAPPATSVPPTAPVSPNPSAVAESTVTEPKPANQIYGRSYVQQMLRKLHPPPLNPTPAEDNTQTQSS